MDQLIEAFSKDPALLIPIILGGLGILAGIIVPVAIQWRIVRVTEENNLLKQALLDRGLTPEEVSVVLNAGTRRGSRHQFNLRWQKPGAAGQKQGCGVC